MTADLPDTFPVTSVVLAGGADTRGPQLTVRAPAKVVDGETAPLFAVLVDRAAPSGYSTPGALGYEAPEVAVYVNKTPATSACRRHERKLAGGGRSPQSGRREPPDHVPHATRPGSGRKNGDDTRTFVE